MFRVVTLVKRKLNGNDGSWLTYHLGDDEDRSWLFHPKGVVENVGSIRLRGLHCRQDIGDLAALE